MFLKKGQLFQNTRLRGMLTFCYNTYDLYYPHDELTLKELSYKLVMLPSLALISGQRCQTLHCLSVSSMKMNDSKCVFTVHVLRKQSRKGKHLAPLELLAFPQNEKLCIVSVLKEYLSSTKKIRRKENQLLLSYQAPHKPVTKNALARWLNGAGVDTAQFSAHSARAASTSAALSSGVGTSGQPVDVVLRAAGWCSESTFTRFYRKEPAVNMESTFTRFYRKEPAVNMGQALLDCYLHKQSS